MIELTLSQVARLLGIRHHAVQVAVKSGRFPPPKDTPHGKVWLLSEIQTVLDSRIWLNGDKIGTRHGQPKKIQPVAESLQKVVTVFEL